MLESITYFIYGWICGVIAVPLCYIFDIGALLSFFPHGNVLFKFLSRKLFGQEIYFNTKRPFADTISGSIPESVIDSLVGGGIHKNKEREKDAQPQCGRFEGIGISSILQASVCRLGWYDGAEFIAALHDARLVLYEKHLMVHEVGASRSMGHHERVITSERLIGRIQTSRIGVRGAVIDSNSRRSGSGTSVLQGHVLLISVMDDGPLFDEPVNMANASYMWKQSTFFHSGTHSNSTAKMNSNMNSNSYVNSSNININSNYNSNDSKCDENSVKDLKTKEGNVQSNSSSNSTDNNNNNNSNNNDNSNNNSIDNSCVGAASMVTNESDNRFVRRHVMAVKFYSLREQERWLNLLRAPHEASHWRSYLRTLTTPNAFNLLLTRILVQSMRTTALGNFIHAKIQKKLDSLSVKKFPREIEGRIILDDFLLSDEVPMVSNVSEPSITANGEVAFDFDILYRGGATLCLRLNLTYRALRIPHVVCTLTIERAAARLRLSVGPPPSKKFWLGLLSPPSVRLSVAPGLKPPAHHGPLHRLIAALPDLSPVASQLLRLYLLGEMAFPIMDDYPLPSVEKTPPTTPAEKKAWNTMFDRKDAAAHSRARPAAKTAATSTTTATETGVTRGVTFFVDGIKHYTGKLVGVLGGTRSETPKSEESPPPPPPPPPPLNDPLQEGEKEEKSKLPTAMPIICKSPVSPSVSSSTAIPQNSEDGRRHQLKAKSEEIMRPAVRTADRLPPPSNAGKNV